MTQRYEFEHNGYRITPFGQRPLNLKHYAACARFVKGDRQAVLDLGGAFPTEEVAREAAVIWATEVASDPQGRLPF